LTGAEWTRRDRSSVPGWLPCRLATSSSAPQGLPIFVSGQGCTCAKAGDAHARSANVETCGRKRIRYSFSGLGRNVCMSAADGGSMNTRRGGGTNAANVGRAHAICQGRRYPAHVRASVPSLPPLLPLAAQSTHPRNLRCYAPPLCVDRMHVERPCLDACRCSCCRCSFCRCSSYAWPHRYGLRTTSSFVISTITDSRTLGPIRGASQNAAASSSLPPTTVSTDSSPGSRTARRKARRVSSQQAVCSSIL
jgi:hypothetical protein